MKPLLTIEHNHTALISFLPPLRFAQWYIPRHESEIIDNNEIQTATQFIEVSNTVILYAMMYAVNSVKAFITKPEPSVFFYFVLKGEHSITIQNAGQLKLRAGHFIVVSHPAMQAQLQMPAVKDHVIFILMPAVEDVVSRLALYPELHGERMQLNKRAPFIFGRQPFFMHASFFNVIKRITQAPFTEDLKQVCIELCAALIHLAFSQIQKQQVIAHTGQVFSFAHDIKNIIHAGALQHLSISEIARKSGHGSNKISGVFKKVFGVSLGSYIRNWKLQSAWNMLVETQVPVKKIAYACGYSNAANFCQAFKNRFHITPSSLRKKSS
ncbi:helix-turn-helix domain-containing protein [Panacibacter ginsenosidivorans]|uniref:Helix-turn-helix domain-containing protein n=1 Tax=Panacibacter ginsenosidivorans TaxID=1813871 RepID=A0A5B8V9J4_9BACT|nr:AraC family transcriptional regulator [Panacibacter ginsenosidivorans]QEC67919.1 helix-turn-helix domain-containing protein [Panacibacter ginsenosidivorans]